MLRVFVGAFLAAFCACGAAAQSVEPGQPSEIIIFTDRDQAFIEFLIGVFSVESGVSVKVDYGEPGDLAARRAQDPTYRADVILATDAGWVDRLAREGGTAPIDAEEVIGRVPRQLRHPEGRWFGVTQRARALHVAPTRVAKDEIATYEQLAEPRFRGRLCSRALSHGYSRKLIAAMIAHHGREGARKWLEGLRANLATAPQGNDRAQILKVSGGFCDIALANTYYRGIMGEIKDQRPAVDATLMLVPSFDDGAHHVTVSSAALLTDAPHPKEALTFLSFLVSDLGQQIMMILSYEHPVVPSVELDGAVEVWGPLKPDEVPLSELFALEPEAESLVRELGLE